MTAPKLIDLWAIALIDLGLSEDEFRRLTLKEFDALCKRKRIVDRKVSYNFALVCSTIYNSIRTKRTQKVWRPEDFIGKEKEKRIMTEKEIKDMVLVLNKIYNGKVISNGRNR